MKVEDLKMGDLINVYCDEKWVQRKFHMPGMDGDVLCIRLGHEIKFDNRQSFDVIRWTHWEPIEPTPNTGDPGWEPFTKVMARYDSDYNWYINFYCYYAGYSKHPYTCLRNSFGQIALYDGNEKYLNTKDDIPGAYKCSQE